MDSEVIKKYREAGKIAKEALELGCDLVEAERYLEEVAILRNFLIAQIEHT